jgi:undecaprenyl-diphosphatase
MSVTPRARAAARVRRVSRRRDRFDLVTETACGLWVEFASMTYLLVLNAGAGTEEADAFEERAQRELPDVRTVHLGEEGLDLSAIVREAVREGRTVVAAGGDGTVNAVVQDVVHADGVLGVLPAGTLNHFARDLGVERIDDAFSALSEGHTARVDVGRIGDRLFVNNATFGLYPEVVEERERHEDRLGKWIALARASLRMLLRALPLEGTVSADGDARGLFAWILFIANNRVEFAPGRIGQRPRLDEGVLDVHVMTAGRRAAVSRASAAWAVLAAHSWRKHRLIRTDARTVEVELRGGGRPYAYDGETAEAVGSVRAEILPRALRVVRPAGTSGG